MEEKNGNIKLFVINLRKMTVKNPEIITQIVPKKCFKNDDILYIIGTQGEMIGYSMKDYKMITDVNEIGKPTVKSEFRSERMYFDPLIKRNFVLLSKQMISYFNFYSQIPQNENEILQKRKQFEGQQRNCEMMKLYPKIVNMKNGIIIGGGFLTNGDLIIITQQWLSILQSLPEPFRFYGKMAKINK